MTSTLRIALLIAIVIYYIIVINLLRKGKLSLRYSLIWLFMGICLALILIFPNILVEFSNLIGIVEPINGLFTVIIGFILMLLMLISSIVSKQSDKIKNLTQDNALLEKRIRELEEKI